MKEQDLLNLEIIKTYEYTVYLKQGCILYHESEYVFIIDGKKYKSPFNTLSIKTTDKLNWDEVYRKFSGTEGIRLIEGDFKED